MISTKAIFDLIAKMNRNNKDRQVGNDLLELTRQMKGFDKNLQDLFNNKVAAGLEIERLKAEIARLKKGGAPTTSGSAAMPEPPKPQAPKPDAPPRLSFEGAVWHSGSDPKK